MHNCRNKNAALNNPPPQRGEGVIQCLQINLHHCFNAVKSFNDWMATSVHTTPTTTTNKRNQKIGLICEPYINETDNLVKDFSKDCNVFYENKKGKVRTCIVTSKNLDVWPLHQFNSGDQSVIGTKTKNGKIVILAATYMGHDSKEGPPPNILKALQKYCETKNFSLIVGSDCNSHHEIWGSSDTNNRGENLLDFIFNSNLHILNIGNTHTFADARHQEVLDITLASNEIFDDVSVKYFDASPLKKSTNIFEGEIVVKRH